MHYYKFNISAWALSTSHLSLDEEAIYFRLINFYYDTETPIPLDTNPIFRRLRFGECADTAKLILSEFFEETEKGFVHKKCELLLKNYRKTLKKNKENGEKGGRPRKQAGCRETQQEPNGLISETQQEPKDNPNYKLLTTNEELRTKETKDMSTVVDLPARKDKIPYQKIIDAYNAELSDQLGLPRVAVLNEKRKRLIKKAWKFQAVGNNTQQVEYWIKYFRHMTTIDWINPNREKSGEFENWVANFDYCIREETWTKIIEGVM